MAKLTIKAHSVDPDYCDAVMGEHAITGWIIRRNGEPAYFQVEGRNGLCVPIDKVADVRPVS